MKKLILSRKDIILLFTLVTIYILFNSLIVFYADLFNNEGSVIILSILFIALKSKSIFFLVISFIPIILWFYRIIETHVTECKLRVICGDTYGKLTFRFFITVILIQVSSLLFLGITFFYQLKNSSKSEALVEAFALYGKFFFLFLAIDIIESIILFKKR